MGTETRWDTPYPGDQSAAAGRVPPHSVEAELSVLGAVLIGGRDAAEAACETLRAAHFYREAHQWVFDAVEALTARGEPADIVTVANALKDRDAAWFEAASMMAYLVQLSEFVATAANVRYHAGIVREKAILRGVIEAAAQMAGLAYAGEDARAVLSEGERLLSAAGEEGGAGEAGATLRDILPDLIEHLDARQQAGGGILGIPCLLTKIDEAHSGFHPGDLTIIAARPAMGKTGCAGTLARNFAGQNRPGVFFSLEMPKKQLVNRWLCAEAGVNMQNLKNARLSDEEWRRIMAAKDRLWDLPFEIVDGPGLNAAQIRAAARRAKRRFGGLEWVVVDYAQIMGGQGTRRADEAERLRIAENAYSLKDMAKELDVSVILLSQLSRAVEKRENKRPMLSDLAESGALEAAADNVCFLYRDAYYAARAGHAGGTEGVGGVADAAAAEPEIDTSRAAAAVADGAVPVEEVEWIIGKQRNGPVGFVKIGAQMAYSRFVNIDPDERF